MTIEQTGIIMDILTTAYPRFYSGPDAPDMVKTLRLWAEMFARDDVALVAAAVKALIESDPLRLWPIKTNGGLTKASPSHGPMNTAKAKAAS